MTVRLHTQRGHVPRKHLGQHFLVDAHVIATILNLLNPQPQDHLVEIGPGQGALTWPLLRRLPTVLLDVVEFDRDLVPALSAVQNQYAGFTVHQQDALTFDFAKLQQSERKLRIFGNLPYNISTPLLFHLLTFSPCIQDMLFMLQKEVAERLAATVDSEHYGRLSVMMQYHCQVDLLLDIEPTAFSPPPKVTSSMVKLTPWATLPHVAEDYAAFAHIVKLAFGQRRKTLRNSLKQVITDEIWATLPVRPQQRAEEVSVASFVALSNVLTKNQV